MKATIVQKFKIGDIEKQLNTTGERIRKSAVNTMCYVGEQCIRQARDNGDYNDITGNLRSSIGYCVLQNGKVVQNSKDKAYSGPEGSGHEGLLEGKKFLQKLQGDYPKGIVLILAAGMKYAVYVEDIHGRDVLTSAELLARNLVPVLLKKIGLA